MPNFDFIQNRQQVPAVTEVDFNFGAVSIKILAGSSNVMTAVWAEPTAGRAVGKMHVTSYGGGAAFSVLDLSAKILFDRYTISIKGRANEILEQEDTKDLVAGGE